MFRKTLDSIDWARKGMSKFLLAWVLFPIKKHADYEYAILPIYILMAEIVFSKKEIDKFAFIIKLLLT